MSDPSKIARWQSSALVIAALISTTGAVSSALIQTGWFGNKAPTSTIGVSSPGVSSFNAHPVRASFAGFIEPASYQSTVNSSAPPANMSSTDLKLTPAPSPAIFVSKPLVVPNSNKTNRGPIDWQAVPRFFESLW